MSEGLVVESVGRNWRIDSMSPVSATTVVMVRSWSSLLGMKASRGGVGATECRAAARRFQVGKAEPQKATRQGLPVPAVAGMTGRALRG